MRTRLAVGLGLALLVAVGAIAQTARVELKDTDPTRGDTPQVRKISTIMGSEVRMRPSVLGKVADIVINDDGCIDYLIVQDAEEYIAVPWGVVFYEPGARYIHIRSSVTRAALRPMRFRGTSWPNFYSAAWRSSVTSVWGARALRSGHGVGGGRDGVRDGRDGRDDTRKDGVRRDDTRKDASPRDDKRRDDTRKDALPPADKRRDDPSRKDAAPRDDKRRDDTRKDALPPADKRRDDPPRKDDTRKDDKRRDDTRKDDKRPDTPDRP